MLLNFALLNSDSNPACQPHKMLSSGTSVQECDATKAGYQKLIIELYKRWETMCGVSCTFISSVKGRTINKSACGAKIKGIGL